MWQTTYKDLSSVSSSKQWFIFLSLNLKPLDTAEFLHGAELERKMDHNILLGLEDIYDSISSTTYIECIQTEHGHRKWQVWNDDDESKCFCSSEGVKNNECQWTSHIHRDWPQMEVYDSTGLKMLKRQGQIILRYVTWKLFLVLWNSIQNNRAHTQLS